MGHQHTGGIDHVVDVAPGAHLLAIAGDPDLAASQCPQADVVHGALAYLAGAIDVEGPDRGHRHPVLAMVGQAEMLGGELARRVGPAGLGHRPQGGGPGLPGPQRGGAVDLAGGEVDQPLDGPTLDRLQHLLGADQVGDHGGGGLSNVVAHSGHGGQVDDQVHAVEQVVQGPRLGHVPGLEADPGRGIEEPHGVPAAVVHRDHAVVPTEAEDQVGPDEPPTAGEQDPLAGDHGPSSPLTSTALPITSASMAVESKQARASSGVLAMGWPRTLSEVLTTAGTPVRSPKRRIRSW